MMFGVGSSKEKTPHAIFVESQLIPILQKIQRELVWRRFSASKECQTPLQEAILACHEFAEVEYNPIRSSATAETEEETTDEATTTDHEPAALQHDDPQNREVVAPAIERTILALLSVIRNGMPKQIRACELALEGITLLVENRYLAGRAGADDNITILQTTIEGVAKCAESTNETIQLSLIQTVNTILTSPKCEVHENVMLTALRSIFHVYLVTKTYKDEAKTAVLDIMRSVFTRMEAFDRTYADGFASQFHADGYYLFRSLCKLSSKELQADTVDESSKRLFQSIIPTDPTELNSKLLALELIVGALDLAGESFLAPKFVLLVQNYLSGSLLKNCVSNHTQVAYLSQRIFLILLYKFKDYLKQDIEIFMSNVFFRVLESPNSSFKQKALVLESLRSLCRDPVLLTQIFLNYDCNFDGMNLYKDIVHTLTKLGGKATASSKRDEDAELSLAALECLVAILRAFLKALSLNTGEEAADTAGARIRGLLQLDAALMQTESSIADVESVLSEETSGAFNAAEKIVNAFDRKQMAQQNFEIGAVKFTLSLKTGLRFFIDNGFVECDAKAIANFFLEHKDKLDKTQMGEALGREPDASFVKGDEVAPDMGGPGFWVRILHHYINALDFTELMFDDAIRLFLSGFRLPGEAQKIDRIMEKFAERYTSQNPSVFPSADTAFILAFSVIMLNTDLHNPSIKPERRMTIESFLRNNRGIGDEGSDLPEEFLTGIFNRIKEKPFTLKEDDAARERVGNGQKQQLFDPPVFFDGQSTLFGASAEERRREKFKKERDEMMAATEQLVRRRQPKTQAASGSDEIKIRETIPPSEVVKPMFDVTWGPMLGILSQVMECADDDSSIAVCLNGFVFAIRLAAHSDMSLARDTFVSSLAKFTYLGSIKEMKRKNVESIRTLLSVAVVDGDHLGESFGPVLQCMSQMAKLRLSASGLESDESFLLVDSPRKGLPSGTQKNPSKGELAKEAEESNGKAVLEAVQEVLIDKVFSSTVNLSATSLAHFVQQLIIVATSEINGSNSTGPAKTTSTMDISGNSSGPSIFSLQRLVEVADFNMDVRPRLVWSQVWGYMADFFVDLACHRNEMVSVFAIDSLKQLSLKFLEKPELSEFNFQSSFLKPFSIVMEHKGTREGVRELVLQCVDNVIRAKAHNLRSGWKIIFNILTLSANDKSEKIEYLGLSILQRLLDEHIEAIECLRSNFVDDNSPKEKEQSEGRIRNALADDFVHLCKASLSFVQNEAADSLRPFGLTMRAFCHVAIYADLIANLRILPPISGAQDTDPSAQGFTYGSPLSDDESLELVLWRPLFEGLARGIKSTAATSGSGIGCLVQRGSVLCLRAILLRHGHLFSTPQLTAILRETVIPAVQAAAEQEESPILQILSEGPAMSTFDFISPAPPLPPDVDHQKLLEFREHNMTKKRHIGPAELMLEASFTDLRHGGDGDLRKAASLAQKSSEEKAIDMPPFPDSWIAITAPVALGLFSDLCSEFLFYRGEEGRVTLWPLIVDQFKHWCIGLESEDVGTWRPCEALVRIACQELFRLPQRMFADAEFNDLPHSEQDAWADAFLACFADILASSVSKQGALIQSLLDAKEQTSSMRLTDDFDTDEMTSKINVEPFGSGSLLKSVENPNTKYLTQVIELGFGGMLYRPLQPAVQQISEMNRPPTIPGAEIPFEVAVPDAFWVSIVPWLKIRCVATHCLQQEFDNIIGLFPQNCKQNLKSIRSCLENSRRLAAEALKDETVSMVFRESLLKDWGDGIQAPDESTEATSRLALLHGSDVFFLTQEAGATKAYIHLSTALQDGSSTDPAFLDFMTAVLDSYISSENKIGLNRPTRAALYCNTFSSTIVNILKSMVLSDSPGSLFPRLCALVQSNNPEIRECVQDVMLKQVAPMIGVTIPRDMTFRRISSTVSNS